MREGSNEMGWGKMWGCERLGTEVLMKGVEVRIREVSSGYFQTKNMYVYGGFCGRLSTRYSEALMIYSDLESKSPHL